MKTKAKTNDELVASTFKMPRLLHTEIRVNQLTQHPKPTYESFLITLLELGLTSLKKVQSNNKAV